METFCGFRVASKSNHAENAKPQIKKEAIPIPIFFRMVVLAIPRIKRVQVQLEEDLQSMESKGL